MSQSRFLADVVAGLNARDRYVPGKYLWDDAGSRIFEAITVTPAYYHNAAEYALTKTALPFISRRLGRGSTIVEFGSGASRKTRQLLDGLAAPARYVALDISAEFLESSAKAIAIDYPSIDVRAVCADYSQPLPPLPIDTSGPLLGYLPGTSIGNMTPDEARALLVQIRATLSRGLMLMGNDPNRDPVSLQGAYEGDLMTALHKNLLARLQRELGFCLDLDAFRHESRTFANRVEPHLVAIVDTVLESAEYAFHLRAGESIRTDMSWKYTVAEFTDLVVSAGWSVERQWPDPAGRFCLHLLRVGQERT